MRVNREVQTVNWEAGQEGAVETGVKRGLKSRIDRELEAKIAHKPWIMEGAKPWSANREFGTFSLQDSSVSVHNVDFMVCPPLEKYPKRSENNFLSEFGGIFGHFLRTPPSLGHRARPQGREGPRPMPIPIEYTRSSLVFPRRGHTP